jgi:hypothetical protein
MEEEKSEGKRKSKELYWVLGTMLGLVIIFLVASSVFQSLRTFDYNGLTFTKEYFGDIPIYRYSYNSIVTGSATSPKDIRPVNLVLRGDPRENAVPIDGKVELPRGKTVYFGFNSEGLTQCPYSTLSVATFSSFLASNGFTVRGGTTNETEANETNIDFVTCEQFPENPVIIFQASDETSINKENTCYNVNVANCEILPAVEKFMVQALIEAKERANI